MSALNFITLLKQPYSRANTLTGILTPVFQTELTVFAQAETIPHDRTVATKLQIQTVERYARLTLDDGNIINCYEVLLQPQVLLERNRIGIQQFVRQLMTAGDNALISFVQNEKPVWRLTFVQNTAYIDTQTFDSVSYFTNAKRYTYIINPGETNRTLAERLQQLAQKPFKIIDDIVQTFSVEALSNDFFNEYKAHYQAFADYLLATPNYYTAFFNNDDKAVRDFAKKLLGRIIFLYFVQKKGWLACPPDTTVWQDGDAQFMTTLFEKNEHKTLFYTEQLQRLFFEALNTPRPDDAFVLHYANETVQVRMPFLNGGLFEKEQYDQYAINFPPNFFKTNGIAADTPKTLKNKAARGFLDFLNAYNFTIQEDAPNDHTVAVDPEMLGNIFENLLEDNKDKGAYYTPKAIVHYMCQESLTTYLATALLPDALPDTMEYTDLKAFVQTKTLNNFAETHRNSLQMLLQNVKICDPAIGSGAFPMGLLQEIYQLQIALHPADTTPNYAALKQHIIQNSIYGVDIERGAIDIARLRFWLSLIVDETRPQPLPNLDYKIMQGNSLLEWFGGIDLSKILDDKTADATLKLKDRQISMFSNQPKDAQTVMTFSETKLDEFHKLVHTYFDTQNQVNKKAIRDKINKIVQANIKHNFTEQRDVLTKRFNEDIALKRSIMIVATDTIAKKKQKTEKQEYYDKKIQQTALEIENLAQKLNTLLRIETERAPRPYFLWHLFFKDVFAQGGFDIVIGNPPYVRADNPNFLQQRTDILNCRKYTTLTDKWDLYVAFIEKGYDILAPDGVMTYIIPDAYMTSKYAQKSQQYFLENANINRINFLADIKVFQAAVKNIIFEYSKRQNPQNQPIRIKHTDTFQNQTILPTNLQTHLLNDTFKINIDQQTLGNLEDTIAWERICYVSYGLRPSSDERFWKGEFKKEDLISNTQDATHPKPYVEGKCLKKYVVENIKYLEWGTERSPAKLVRPTFPELYTPPKILRGRMTEAIYDEQGLLCNDSCFVSVLWHSLSAVDNRSINGSVRKDFGVEGDKEALAYYRARLAKTSLGFDLKYLLAILNSDFGRYYLNSVRRSQLGFYPDDLKGLPIKSISLAEQAPYIAAVETIMAQKSAGIDSTAAEAALNVQVCALYGIAPHDLAGHSA